MKAEAQKAVDLGFMESNPLASFDAGIMSADNYAKIDLHKNYVDNITLVSPTGKPMKRESDLIDVWFDSGAMPYAQWHYPFENSIFNLDTYCFLYTDKGTDKGTDKRQHLQKLANC